MAEVGVAKVGFSLETLVTFENKWTQFWPTRGFRVIYHPVTPSGYTPDLTVKQEKLVYWNCYKFQKQEDSRFLVDNLWMKQSLFQEQATL